MAEEQPAELTTTASTCACRKASMLRRGRARAVGGAPVGGGGGAGQGGGGGGGRAAGRGDALPQEEGAQPPGEGRPAVGQDLRPRALHDAPVGDAGGADGLAVGALEAEIEVADGGGGRGDGPL